ncbi:GDP-mannose mannosyl hydrolase [Rheinheimera maricola]|uniref:GDP-mannose mannosyl hydrolase n=1 Tax=Rheinheimera maricola TaxID=2793282 RepID=A0ABS7X464_9GAMM|nr:GDP-mannose mannosyl hydrolase [Rheinheimera maricola]MBZ9610344.1 GDP-mannose mannosyl hydrolase [Rheinheimera maricola]
MYLDNKTFVTVVSNTPLVSIDLIVENARGELLLGQRKNRPAQGFWFVPGGRILKNETLAAAFERLTLNELGLKFSIEDATLQGPYDHFYTDSVFGDAPSTHYVAIAYRLRVAQLVNLPQEQHADYQWFSVADLLFEPQVHQHTKAYFLND